MQYVMQMVAAAVIAGGVTWLMWRWFKYRDAAFEGRMNHAKANLARPGSPAAASVRLRQTRAPIKMVFDLEPGRTSYHIRHGHGTFGVGSTLINPRGDRFERACREVSDDAVEVVFHDPVRDPGWKVVLYL